MRLSDTYYALWLTFGCKIQKWKSNIHRKNNSSDWQIALQLDFYVMYISLRVLCSESTIIEHFLCKGH